MGAQLTMHEGLVNTYFSRDGGHEWFEVAKGSHIYEFGDHGGIIVMANDEAEVTELLYSWNEGVTWETLKFTSTPVLVDNIMIEPRGASERFLLYGTRVSMEVETAGLRLGVVFSLDFSELHPRQCGGEDAAGTEASDFERWAPSASNKGDGCLMGRRVEYTRRKRDRACFNPDDIQITHFIANCECTDLDYECDRGYRRIPLDGGPCVRDPDVPIHTEHLVPHYCVPGMHYHVTNGYRRVAGDSCAGGVQHEGFIVPCPGSKWHHTVSHGGWAVMLAFITLGSALAAITYCQAIGGKATFRGPTGGGGTGSRLGSMSGGGAGVGGGGGRIALPAWVPSMVARPVGLLAALSARGVILAASGVYHVWDAAASAVRAARAGGGSGGRASLPQYGRLGKESVEALVQDDDDPFGDKPPRSGSSGGGASAAAAAAASGVGGSRRTGGGDDDDADFGVNADDDAEGSGGGARRGALLGGDDEDADLLGIARPGPLHAAGSSAAGAASRAAVPVLRPPRSHDAAAAPASKHE